MILMDTNTKISIIRIISIHLYISILSHFSLLFKLNFDTLGWIMDSVKNNNTGLSQIIKSEPAIFSLLKLGDLVQGSVLEKGANAIVINLGKHGTGVIYGNEIQNARNLVKNLKIGDNIHAKVVQLDNEEGFTELSLAEAGKQKAWAGILELSEKEEIIKVKPTSFNKGGLITELNGLQAFLPISQLSNEHYPKTMQDDKNEISEALQKLIGEELSVKIIDVNPRTNKIILSEKAVQELSSKEFVKNYEVGQLIEGIVSGVADFGAFVRFTDNPVVEGLIHVSELDWRMVENPKEVVKVDDVIKAKIIEIKDGKIFLSLKILQTDPWEKVGERYAEGQEIVGTVYGFHPFGAIINLDNQIQGQLHVAEFGSVAEMKKQLSIGSEHRFIIENIKPEDKRIILKIKK